MSKEDLLINQVTQPEVVGASDPVAQEQRISARLADSRVGRTVAALATGIVGAWAAETFVAAPASAATPAAATVPWSNYGHDPMWPRTAHSKAGTRTELTFQHHVASRRDETAMQEMGIPVVGIKAIRAAARRGDVRLKHYPYGTVVEKMTYDPTIEVEDNAQFVDPHHKNGFDMYQTTGTVTTKKAVTHKVHGKVEKGTETIVRSWTYGEPTLCGNGALISEKVHVNIKYQQPVKPPKKTETPPTTTITTTVTTSAPPTPTPTPPTPPAQPAAPSAVLNPMQEVYEGQQDTAEALVTAPSGDILQVCFDAFGSDPNESGSFAEECISEIGAGSTPVTVKDVYTAPDEVTTVDALVTVYDETTGEDNSTQTDNQNQKLIDVTAPPTGRPS